MDGVRETVAGVDPLWQWLAVLVAAGVPYVESYGAGAIGVLVGVAPPVAVVAAVVGNVATMLLAVTLGAAANDRWRRRRAARGVEPSARRQRLKQRFDRYGVAGVSLLGQTLLPSQVVAMALVSFGADRRLVVLWQVVSIVLWGVAFTALAAAGVAVLG